MCIHTYVFYVFKVSSSNIRVYINIKERKQYRCPELNTYASISALNKTAATRSVCIHSKIKMCQSCLCDMKHVSYTTRVWHMKPNDTKQENNHEMHVARDILCIAYFLFIEFFITECQARSCNWFTAIPTQTPALVLNFSLISSTLVTA